MAQDMESCDPAAPGEQAGKLLEPARSGFKEMDIDTRSQTIQKCCRSDDPGIDRQHLARPIGDRISRAPRLDRRPPHSHPPLPARAERTCQTTKLRSRRRRPRI